jgi:hypothetical protein
MIYFLNEQGGCRRQGTRSAIVPALRNIHPQAYPQAFPGVENAL